MDLSIINYDRNATKTFEYDVPGLVTGCFPMNSLFVSTLECLYDQMCVNVIQQNLALSIDESRFAILNSSLNRRNETVNEILNRLMVDKWNLRINYSSYFDVCSPLFCTYNFVSRRGWTYFLATVIGIFGGLVKIVHIVIRLVVKCYRQLKRGNNCKCQFIKEIYQKLISMNLYFKVNSNESELVVQRQISRLYVFSLFMSILIVSMLILLPKQIKEISIMNPTLNDYNELSSSNKIKVVCSCSRLSISYSRRIDLRSKVIFHEICSSDLISSEWVWSMFVVGANEYRVNGTFRLPSPTNFRSMSNYYFELLSDLCQIANSTVIDAFNEFLSQEFVNSFLLSRSELNQHLISLFHQIQQSSSTTLMTNLRLIRLYIHGNGLLPLITSNWRFVVNQMNPYSIVRTKPLIYQDSNGKNCSCSLSSLCIEQAQLDNHQILPGLLVGCFPFEALLQSTLQMFYNQTFINLLSTNNSNQSTFRSLSNPTRYPLNTTTVESLVSQLMIEEWPSPIDFISYDNYFNQCLPLSCKYTSETRQDFIVSFTRILGFAGTLSVGLDILMSFLLHTIQLYQLRQIQTFPIY